MRKVFLWIFGILFVVSLGLIAVIEFVPSYAQYFIEYKSIIYLTGIFSLTLIVIILCFTFYKHEISDDVYEKRPRKVKKAKKMVQEKPLFSDVEKKELGLSLTPDKVLDEVSEPQKVVEEKVTQEPIKEEVQETVVEETPTEPIKQEEVIEPVNEVQEEVKEEVVQEPITKETIEAKEEVVEQPVEQPKEEVSEVKEETKPIYTGPLKKLSPTILAPFKMFNDTTYAIGKMWADFFNNEASKKYFSDMVEFLQTAYEKNNVYPPKEDLMRCFEYCDFDNVRVVIIGKFPFYRKNQADGLAYSTRRGLAPNQTTSIIIKEAINDVNIPVTNSGSLEKWAKNGVLLLNSIMTAPSDKPASHTDCGWLTFTNSIIDLLNVDNNPKVFVLWGEYAQSLKPLITNEKHLIIEAPNPSPLSAANGFYGSKPFSKINEFLTNNGIEPIDWTL